jgi:hypothetical protein
MSSPGAPGFRLSKGIAGIAVCAALVAAPTLIGIVSDVLFYPWARADPPLVDTWVGRLTTGDGHPRGVIMALERARGPQGRGPCARCAKLEGTAATCDERGRELRYRVSGSPEDRQATTLHIGASAAVEPHPDGLQLSSIHGRWNGGDSLDVAAEFYWRRGTSAISSTGDPATNDVPLPMTRGDVEAFRAICRRVASR